jgi:hypothetical protein
MPFSPTQAAPSPCPRSSAQIEAARQNGARSRGPVSPEGKARAARNALKHGLAAIKHLVLDDEDQAELDALTESLMAEIGPTSEVEARLVQRLAAAFWKGERAERLEAALFAAAPTLQPPLRGGAWVEADPLATFDLARFNAIRAYQAQQGRELSRCLRELRLLRREPLTAEADEPEHAPATAELETRNEPGEPATAPPLAAQAPAPASPPPPAEVENEPKTLARADLPLLRPRHPVPLPGLLDAAVRVHGTMLMTVPCSRYPGDSGSSS